MRRPYIIFKHAKIAELRELACKNYFGFIFLSMFNNKNLETANAADYTNHSSLVKYKTDNHNMAAKDYDQTKD